MENEKKNVSWTNRIFALTIFILAIITVIGVMLAFYGTPMINEDTGLEDPYPALVWGLEFYPDFFRQMYGTTVMLGLSSFALSAVVIASSSLFNIEKEFSLIKLIALCVTLLIGAVLAATAFIYIVVALTVLATVGLWIVKNFTDLIKEENE